jgi:hypothetical protein
MVQDKNTSSENCTGHPGSFNKHMKRMRRISQKYLWMIQKKIWCKQHYDSSNWHMGNMFIFCQFLVEAQNYMVITC